MLPIRDTIPGRNPSIVVQSFGLPVRCDIPSEFFDLMHLYPQPVRRQPTVEYLLERRRYEGFRGTRD